MNEIDTIMKLRVVYRELDEQFDIGYNDFLAIKISSRLRCSNGRCEWHTRFATGEVYGCKIIMSKALLDEFGWERFEKTFRHEVAHLANAVNGGNAHDKAFKRFCRAFGGSMNPKMAGSRYADCADTDFVRVIPKWIYTCPCGHSFNMARRMAYKKRVVRASRYTCAICKIHTLDKWTEKQIR